MRNPWNDGPAAWPSELSTRARAVVRALRPLAPEVHRAVVAQNAELGRLAPSAARDANIAALGSGAAAVVTGQQVGLFLGPLYTVYKAASAVVVARRLAAELAMPVVPVFWLQTEDHDLAEIASCTVPARAGRQGGGEGGCQEACQEGCQERCKTIAVPVDAGSRVSIAHCTLPDAIVDCLDQLDDALGDGPLARGHVERLRRYYRPGVAWAAAFAGVLAELFAPEGLVMIDPRDPALAASVAPVHERALEAAEPIAAALIARCSELSQAGSPVPVHVRAGAPLSFFHPDGALGPRVRLEPVGGDAFAEVGSGRVHDRAALVAALRADPRRFSTSALLRPIAQDTLLPTVAYVGGPSEIAYFAQLAPVYRAFGRTPPFAVPRARFRVTDARTRKLLGRLGLSPGDAELSEAALLSRLCPARLDASAIAGRLLAPFVAAHAEVAAQLADGGPVIARALARTRGSVERSVGKLAAKIERTRSYADAERVDAVRRLRALLAPGGAPQERVHGLAGLAARVGDRSLIERALDAIDPFDGSLRELAA